MTTIVIPTWLAWTLGILFGLPLAIISILMLIIVIAAVVTWIGGKGKVSKDTLNI